MLLANISRKAFAGADIVRVMDLQQVLRAQYGAVLHGPDIALAGPGAGRRTQPGLLGLAFSWVGI